ncbi:hypothetical protein PM10SUCC1_14760 [Propionigenium maris DSM 9537]|uniref:Uncharacterized protein n=1 Tax=Propionigenium maris DSM 9537 TaxID=1123000 RepID=A0A9W6GLW1_9FUSO|nr:hypothetical protein [Propionigenium maris]GLI55962.1 hypothetical protein PM10SUCC1_14760 [Propionigenium maris DSM 9537]
MQAHVQGIVVSEVKEVEFEGKHYYSLIQDGGLAKPKWKISREMFHGLMAENVVPGDKLNLVVNLNYYPKTNGFNFADVAAFKKVK